ncbi:hypothetical protein FB554_2045 [Barrientosiimonas humi]|uniref:Uncharacterized protein n=2 Tax=Barrientosiimonas TaxID=1535207 RepID=A0A542XDH8_9MICO|nr:MULTISPECIES: hypothetical protein [Barrientosiimonas]TQL33889.1 hypothetical protein FB554_2045 [Barrientosiimonas humi]BDZ58843.1 hypothetical protein GCM10025872_25000 [Barrientosiimonas endolithica]CAG7573879.1 hypothetical protein BH39T_PBIAJDOK_02521 [Barrientosiimonas humi]
MHRWQDLFADLEAQLRHAEQRELDAEVSDRTRRERSEVRWLDRAAANLGASLVISTAVGPVAGRLDDLGRDWLLLGDERGRQATLLPAAAVLGVSGLGRAADGDEGLGRRFGIGVALRAVSRDRAAVELRDTAGSHVAGTIDVVGADYLEVAEHPVDVPRRPDSITGMRVVTFAGLVLVRRV